MLFLSDQIKTQLLVSAQQSEGDVLSAAMLQEEAFDYLDAPIKRVASPEVPLPYAKPLEMAALTGAKQLIDAINQIAPRRRRYSHV